MRQANHNYYLWSDGTKTMWLSCSWHSNQFNLPYDLKDDDFWKLQQQIFPQMKLCEQCSTIGCFKNGCPCGCQV